MDGSLSDILDGYLDLRLRLDPVEATRVGVHALDGEWADWSAPAVRQQLAALRSYAGSLEEAEADTLDDEIDRTAALHAVRHDIMLLEEERRIARDPAHHLSHLLGGLYLLVARDHPDPAARAAALLRRLQGIPDFLERARAALTHPARVFVDTARDMLRGGMLLIAEGLDDPTLDLTAVDELELRQARDEARDALRAFADALAEMEGAASDDFAIGRALFDRKLHTAHMIRDGADELYRYGERLRDEAYDQLERTAAELEAGTSWRDLLRRLSTDIPTPEGAVQAYGGALQAARAYVQSRHLVPVPDARLVIRPTPDFLKPLTPFAAYVPPGAADPAQTGIFLVSLPDEDEGWRTHAWAELPGVAVHEGVPGHHLHFTTINRLARPVRRLIGTPATVEGWALYCETLMADEGFLTTGEERLFQAHHLLWRALRVLLDVSLHTRGMTMPEAAAVLQDELGFDQASATAEARRYCAYPTYQLCYAVGRREILRLRDDARAARGAEFRLPDFHRELLQFGALPTALARWGMGLVDDDR